MARYRSALSVLLLALVVSHAHGRELQQLTGLLGGVLGLVTGPQLPPLPLTVRWTFCLSFTADMSYQL